MINDTQNKMIKNLNVKLRELGSIVNELNHEKDKFINESIKDLDDESRIKVKSLIRDIDSAKNDGSILNNMPAFKSKINDIVVSMKKEEKNK